MTSSPSDQVAQATQATQEPQEAIHAALAALDGLDTVPVGEHAEGFDRVHTALADALSAIDGV